MVKRLRNENPYLDAVDLHILRFLAEDARTSVAEIARSVGMSAPSVSERIRRLQDSGTIQAYTIRIDQAAFGLPLSAWVRIRPVPGQLAKVAEILQTIGEIVSCDRVTGEDCFIARLQVRSIIDLEVVIDRISPYAMTNTAIIQSSPVAPRLPVVTDDAG